MLARSNSSKKDVHVVWDEENLKANEEIQKDYSAVTISEPKTPYRPPLSSDSLENDMKPLQLDEASMADAFRPDRMTAFDYVLSNGGAAFDGAEVSQPPQQQQQLAATTSNVSSEADGDRIMDDAVHDKRSEPCNSFTSSGSDGNEDKRQRFELMRKQHYNMKDTLVKAKQLMASEDEEDGGNPGLLQDHSNEEEEDDTAGWHSSNGTAGAAGSSMQQQEAAGRPTEPDVQQQQHVQLGQAEQQSSAAATACSSGHQQAGSSCS